MRLLSALSEAWRNIRSGTTGVLAFGLAAAVIGVVVGGLAVANVVDGIRTAHEFRTSGATVQTITTEGYVDGDGCDSLAGSDGTLASGALRDAGTVRPLTIPTTRLDEFEVTEGLADVLHVDTLDGVAGIWLSDSLADTLGVRLGDTFATTNGTTTVAGTYAYPDDGRERTLSYAILAPVATTHKNFDACWIDTWPPRSVGDGWTAAALADGITPGDDKLEYAQLNASLGDDLDIAALTGTTAVRYSPAIAAIIGLVLGAVSALRRRVEIASNLHAGVVRRAIAVQVGAETAVWALASAIIAAPVLAWLAVHGNPDAMMVPWLTGVRVVGAQAAASVLGAVAVVCLTFESQLFRLFKER